MRKLLVTVGICVAFAVSGSAFAAPDAKTFVADAIAANNGLVKMGNVGQAKGRPTTQTFAVRMQRDFVHANADLTTLAGTLGVTPTTDVPADVPQPVAREVVVEEPGQFGIVGTIRHRNVSGEPGA